MLLSEIKKLWILFFEENSYFKLEELSIVPKDDDSILWINSGVSALKKYFVETDIIPSRNMVNSQRVIRTNDIERINQESYHQTFFEMLGCFSLGGNFKKEVIPLVWTFLTEKLKIDPENLFITVLDDDYETFSIWEKQHKLSKDRIFFCGKNSNFWDMGDGPCGPNTEIYYCFDINKLNLTNKNLDFDDKNFLEIANLVFSDRYHRGDEYFPLEKKCVDVGVGLERLALVIQKVLSTFQIDIWKSPLLFLKSRCSAELINGELKKSEWKFNVIVDHLRTFIIAVFDGVLPESKHRGYIIKKLIKRAFWASSSLGISTDDLVQLTSIIIEANNHIPHIIDKKDYVVEVVRNELFKLSRSLQSYKNSINNYLEKNPLSEEIPAEEIFFWYDTKGMPIDLVSSYLKKRGFYFDKNKFEQLLNKQKEKGIVDQKSKKTSVF